MSEENSEKTEEYSQETTESNDPELTLSDLNSIKQIIDVASQRGAFRPNEMKTIGEVYEKLETFLSSVTQQSQGDQ